MTHSSHLVDAEITLQFSETKKYEIIQIEGIICNWVSKVFGESIDGFLINNLVSSKAKA